MVMPMILAWVHMGVMVRCPHIVPFFSHNIYFLQTLNKAFNRTFFSVYCWMMVNCQQMINNETYLDRIFPVPALEPPSLLLDSLRSLINTPMLIVLLSQQQTLLSAVKEALTFHEGTHTQRMRRSFFLKDIRALNQVHAQSLDFSGLVS